MEGTALELGGGTAATRRAHRPHVRERAPLLRRLPIDACMLNPGTIKPTALAEVGLRLAERMWAASKPAAKEEYGALLTKLIEHQASEPGTHVSAVAHQMLDIMTAGRPRSGNMVGPDSKATAYVGCLPTGVYESIIKFAVFKTFA